MLKPLIYLGDRGLLKRYGSPFNYQQIKSIAHNLLSTSTLGMASGDWSSAIAISCTLNTHFSARHIYHSRFLIKVIEKSSETSLSIKEIQRNLFKIYSSSNYRFESDERQIVEDIKIVQQCQPGIVTIGGDWLDILIAHRKFSLLKEILRRIEDVLPIETSKVLMSFRPTNVFLSLLERTSITGAAIPVNILNMQYNFTYDYLKSIQKRTNIYAIHCIAGGIIPLRPALDYALHHIHAKACIIGATQDVHIKELINCETTFLRRST